jgi:hypothetical protein
VSVTLRFEGLEALKAKLRALPEDLASEAQGLVEQTAHEAATAIQRAYPRRTGTLRNRVYVTHFPQGRFSAGAVVKNTAPHAALFESGTQARHTAIGANRGAMPPGHIFIPAMQRARRAMWDRLKALMERHDLDVSGQNG